MDAQGLSDLERALLHHEYVTEPGGEARVSVSRISGLIDDGKTEGLMRWARGLANEGKDWEVERNALGDRGTRFHNAMSNHVGGLAVNVRPEELGLFRAGLKWRKELGVQAIESEQIVISRHGFGGRFDEVASLAALDGEICGIDYKTGRLKDREHELQHAGYWNADGLAVYDETGMLTGIRPLPEVRRWFCLQPHDDGTYDFVEYPKRRRGQKHVPIEDLQAAAWDKFCKLLDVYAWLHPTKGVVPA